MKADPRLPDQAFFDIAEGGPCLVMVRYNACGGAKDWFVVNNASELAALVCKMRPRTALSIKQLYCDFNEYEDHVYTADENGVARPGAY